MDFSKLRLTYNNYPTIGFHFSKHDSIYETIQAVNYTPLNAFQIYIANPRMYNMGPNCCINTIDLINSKNLIEDKHLYGCIHGCLLSNLAGSTKGILDPKYTIKLNNTRSCIINELDTGSAMNIGVVVHTGICFDKKFGLHNIAQSINYILSGEGKHTSNISRDYMMGLEDFKKNRRLILENGAGEGNDLGTTLENLSIIMSNISPSLQNQLSICIDTQHIYSAGQYDFGDKESTTKFYSDFNNQIGIDKLKMFHLNDSKVPWNSNVDLHGDYLGSGYIFNSPEKIKNLKYFIELAMLYNIPLIGEPKLSGMLDYNLITNLLK